WDFQGTVIHSNGFILKGDPGETPVQAFLGLDPAKKTVYYLDFHGGMSIFSGTVKLESDKLQFDFQTLVGAPGKWRSIAEFPDPDTYKFTIYGDRGGKWEAVHTGTLKRQK